MYIEIHVSLYAYAIANGVTVLCVIKFVSDLRGRAWREGKEEVAVALYRMCSTGLR